MSLGFAVLGTAMMTPMFKNFLQNKVLPAPGTGPDEKTQNSSWHSTFMQGTSTNGTVVNSVVNFMNEDPGYKSTAHMFAETAMCLVKEKEGVVQEGGFWTTSVCCGEVLRDRLNKTGGNIKFYDMSENKKDK